MVRPNFRQCNSKNQNQRKYLFWVIIPPAQGKTYKLSHKLKEKKLLEANDMEKFQTLKIRKNLKTLIRRRKISSSKSLYSSLKAKYRVN